MKKSISVCLFAMATASLVYGQRSTALSDPKVAAALAIAKATLAHMPVTAGVKTTAIARATPQGAPPYTGLEVSGVLIGYPDPVAPAFNCGAGAISHACTPVPMSRMFVGDPATYLVQWNSDSYTGPCGVAFVLIKVGGGPVAGFNGGLIPAGV